MSGCSSAPAVPMIPVLPRPRFALDRLRGGAAAQSFPTVGVDRITSNMCVEFINTIGAFGCWTASPLCGSQCCPRRVDAHVYRTTRAVFAVAGCGSTGSSWMAEERDPIARRHGRRLFKENTLSVTPSN